MSVLGMRAVAYRLAGERVGVLPDALSMTLTVPVAKTPTVSLSYPSADLGVRGELLDTLGEVAVEVTLDGSTWFEPDGARFQTQKSSWNSLDDGTSPRSTDLVHVSDRLGDAFVWEVPKTAQDSDGKWNFLSATGGAILRTLWDASVRRGWGAGLTLDCTATKDSSGAAWAGVVTLAFDRTISLSQVVESLRGLGLIDVRWSGRTMHAYNADTVMARDRTSLVWRLGAGTTSAPESRSWTDLCTHVLVKGEGGASWVFANHEAPAWLPRTERVVEAGGVSLEATARAVAQAALASGSTTADEVRREWHAADVLLTPWGDYLPGDWMMVERRGGRERLRVVQVSVTRDAKGVSGHTTFGTVLDDLLSRMAKRTKGIVGAATTGGNTVRPSDSVPGRVPAVPQGLVLRTSAQIDDAGRARAVVDADWADVTTDERGVALDVMGYELAWRERGLIAWESVWTKESRGSVGPLKVGVDYEFWVRAYTSEKDGPWTDGVVVRTASDTTPPPVPSRPSLTQTLGVLNVKWDGLGAGGEGMPADYAYTEVSIVAPGAPSERAATMIRPSRQVSVSGLAVQGWEVRLRAVDSSGNASQWSAPSTITLVQNVDADAIAVQVEEKLKKSDALAKVARAETLKEMTHLTKAMTQVATSLVSTAPYPPDEGTVDSTIWVSPDARTFVLRKRGK